MNPDAPFDTDSYENEHEGPVENRHGHAWDYVGVLLTVAVPLAVMAVVALVATLFHRPTR